MVASEFKIYPRFKPALDKDFRPAVLVNRAFLQEVKKSGRGVPLSIAVERWDGLSSRYDTMVFEENIGMDQNNFQYVERLVKTLLWSRGGFKVTVGGPRSIGEYISRAYSRGGLREFDAMFMSRIYERPFSIEVACFEDVPPEKENSRPVGRHLNGCRIGLDLGASVLKVSAVIDGKVVFSENAIWHPKVNSNPDYHFQEILKALRAAASHLPRVDGIGISSAGIYANNKVMAASLFINVPESLFDSKVKNMMINVTKEIGDVCVEVANDGDVTAIAGAMDLGETNVLGISMGTSQAGGYVDGRGNITGWLNELAFMPVDYNMSSAVDEWSGDYGCGVKYLSQDAVIRLIPAAGIEIDDKLTPGEKMRIIQDLHASGDDRVSKIFDTIGCYLGYSIAHYADFYDIKHVMILGGVTSGEGGSIIVNTASEVLHEEFPELAQKIKLYLPEKKLRGIRQSIAAASLPKIS